MEEPILLEQEAEGRRSYKLGIWWIENRARLQKAALVLFGLVDAVLIGFFLWTSVDTFLISYGTERDAIATMAVLGQDDLSAFTRETAGKPIVLSGTTVLTGGEGTYDLYATATNPNGDWYAEFDAFYRLGSGETTHERQFILPGEEKALVALAVRADAPPQDPQLVLDRLTWRRVDKHLTGAYEPWARDRLDFAITGAAFSADLQVDAKTIGRVSFTVKNDSAFGYYDPSFLVRLKRGSSVVGVTRTALSSLRAGESQEVLLNWFGPIPSVSETQVVPEINIFDPKVYIPAGQ
ncbi:hypothetical protein EPO34_02150 [Patescibacteria group bacterium]|nr:MAG: hypothetical protein EPO34_02150 [Patescibacteria group bacterium]